ncbi:DUF5317 domain-containing protein [Schnuerera sp. xch1]|nr:DUF5317 domain-containing protein [Schnuerera sp. xch1]
MSLKKLTNSKLYNRLNLLINNRMLAHVLTAGDTILYYLLDIIMIPEPYPFLKSY